MHSQRFFVVVHINQHFVGLAIVSATFDRHISLELLWRMLRTEPPLSPGLCFTVGSGCMQIM